MQNPGDDAGGLAWRIGADSPTMPLMKNGRILLLALLIAACGRDAAERPAESGPNHAEYRAELEASALAESAMGRSWLAAADGALETPSLVRLPHRERGAFLPHETRTLGIAFDAVDEQRLRISIDVSDDSTGRLFVQLFFAGRTDGGERVREIASFTDLSGGTLTLVNSGRYILRLQPELLAEVDYFLTLELDAALEFPVSGHDRGNVRSLFGDPRDAGSRRHKGIDIFAPRGTPVIAVADGRAAASTSRLGGNIVWLRGRGTSYYYAHLARAAFAGRRHVRAGDILGYVGNSGNAVTTPPHLHFGVYRRGSGAVDPLPYVADLTFADDRPAPPYHPGFVSVAASVLNLREGPGTSYAARGQLMRGTVLSALGTTGEWLRVRTPQALEGWIHTSYRGPVTAQAIEAGLPRDAWLTTTPDFDRPARTRIRAGTSLRVFAYASGWRLVGTGPEPLGWLDPGHRTPFARAGISRRTAVPYPP